MNITEAWNKITGSSVKVGRSGNIPVYEDGEWRIFRNTETIWPYMENGADPVKVDRLRRNVVSLLERYPDTVPQLEKMGIRIKATLNKPIKTPADVAVWAESMFNTGPITADPIHVRDAKVLSYDDFMVQVAGGRHPRYVIPVAPRGSGNMAVYDYTTPGSRARFGPRHDFTKIAFSQQLPRSTQSRPEGVRPRGRPRKDGLVPGSREAKAADRKRARELERERTRRQKARAARKAAPRTRKPAEKLATITELPTPAPRRVLARVGKSAGGVGS